jgi:hypothetical protein
MPKKYLAFDLETAKVLPEHVSDLLAHRPLGICCAAAVASDGLQPKIWYGRKIDGTPAPRMTAQDAQALVHDLHHEVGRGYTLLSWNGLDFDFNILAEESGLRDECAELAANHVDMMFHTLCALGYFPSLDKAAQGMGLGAKAAGVRGHQAPVLWAEGHHSEVQEYNVRDAQLTVALALACERVGVLRWVTRKGTLSAMGLPQGWLQVSRARALPEPDTSWMQDPPRREDFFRWFRTARDKDERSAVERPTLEDASAKKVMGCPRCGQRLRVPLTGASLRCPRCQNVFHS